DSVSQYRPLSSMQMPPHRGQFCETCHSIVLIEARVFPLPVWPTINHPRQKLNRSQENPPSVRMGLGLGEVRGRIPHQTDHAANPPKPTGSQNGMATNRVVTTAAPTLHPAMTKWESMERENRSAWYAASLCYRLNERAFLRDVYATD